MKKILIAIAAIIILMCLFKDGTVIIPKEAIRFRVIANSNTKEDQNIKQNIVKELNKDIKNLKLIPKDIELTRNYIKSNIPTFNKTIEQTLNRMNVSSEYSIEYGMNYFPRKEYKGIIYEAGEYESLVIKLGDAQGDNFWCVLFPPLCLLEAEETESENIEYTSFIKELIEKYF